jgi:hypothetical protein
MRLLICTKNKKYRKLRDALAKLGTGAEVTVLTSITGWISREHNGQWLAVWNAVAIFLNEMLKVSRDVWCQMLAKPREA